MFERHHVENDPDGRFASARAARAKLADRKPLESMGPKGVPAQSKKQCKRAAPVT
jgi:hypothetical protein